MSDLAVWDVSLAGRVCPWRFGCALFFKIITKHARLLEINCGLLAANNSLNLKQNFSESFTFLLSKIRVAYVVEA